MKFAGTLALLLLGTLSASASAAILAESHFTATTENWTTVGDATFNGWQSGGYIQATDITNGGNWYFSAASNFLGNKSGATSLSFDLYANNTDLYDAWDVVLKAGTLTLVADLSPSGLTNPGSSWTSFAVSLTDASSWSVITGNALSGKPIGSAATASNLNTVLGNLSALYIRGEYRSGSDTGRLDNVVLSGNVAPVPEPESYAMLLAGLGLIGAIGRRRVRR